MEISRMLNLFEDTYLIYDKQIGKITDVFPNIESINLPCDVLKIFRFKQMNINRTQAKKLEEFLATSKDKDCMSIESSLGLFSLEIRKTDETIRILHLYNIDFTMKKVSEILSRNQLDPLTNVLGKTAIELYIDSILIKENIQQASVFMIDVDYFKNINDNYGHLFGDKVIVAVAEALQSLALTNGKIGRIGGDEFIFFVEQPLDRIGIKNMARSIRYALDNLKIGGLPFSCTATIGISQFPKDGRNFKELYSSCDKALYRGKEKGRDCHIIFDPEFHFGAKAPLAESTFAPSEIKLSITSFIGMILKKCLQSENINKDEVYKDVADFFNLDRIILCLNHNSILKYIRDPKDSYIKEYDRIDFEEYRKNFTSDDMHYINDVKTWKVKDILIYEIYNRCNTTSAVQVLVNDINQMNGFISYETTTGRRVWQRGELNTLVIITKIFNILYENEK